MLLEFSVSNFMSFEERTTLNMIPSIQNKSKTIELKGINVLKFASIYGANASGKSNLIKAISIMKSIIFRGVRKSLKELYCRTNEVNKNKPTDFSVSFFVNNKYYNYNFSVMLSTGKIISEVLNEINPINDSFKKIYSYNNQKTEFSDVFNIKDVDNFDINRLNTYLFDNVKNDNRLLITELLDKEWTSKKLRFIEDFKSWHNNLNINMVDKPIDNMLYLSNDDERKKVGDILSELNTGVSNISFIEITKEQFIDETKKDFVEETLNDINQRFEQMQKKDPNGELVYTIRGDAYYRITLSNKDNLKINTIRLKHHNCSDMFEFGDESDGTKRLFDLLDIVFTSQHNTVYIIDEIERSLHPVLTYKLIQILDEYLSEKNIQLIFTTHETHIMDLKLFRKDEIWFMEKDSNGHSNLYSLDIFKTRNEKIIRDGYINGLYGGIPLFKKIEE